MALSSALRGFLGGVAGAADKYGSMQDEQRLFEANQAKISAEQSRKMNFEKFKVNKTFQYKPSGLVTKQGKVVTEGQYGEMTPGEQEALESKERFSTRIKEEERSKLAGAKEAKHQKERKERIADQEVGEIRRGKLEEKRYERGYSDEEDPETGMRLTRVQVAEYADAGKGTQPKGQFKEEQKRIYYQIKDKKGALSKIQATPGSQANPYAKTQATSDLMETVQPGSPEYKELIKDKTVQDAMSVTAIKDQVLDMQAGGASKKEILKSLTEKGFSKANVEKAHKMAVAGGEMVSATIFGFEIPFAGYEGRGQ